MASNPTPAEQAAEAAKLQQIVIQSIKHGEAICKIPWVLDYSILLPGTNINFHDLLKILSAIPVIFSTLVCMYLITGHILHFTRPREQKQIIRVILFVPLYSIIAFFSVWFYHVSAFLAPYGQWIEGFALSALFLLYLEIANPGCVNQEEFYSQLERRMFTGKKEGDKGSLRWFRVLNVMVFQLFFTRIATVIGQDIFLGLTCPLSPKRATGLTVIQFLSDSSTIPSLPDRHLLTNAPSISAACATKWRNTESTGKLWSFKAVAGLDTIQVVIFPTLAENKIFQPSPPFYVSSNDFSLALPSFLLVWEMVFVSAAFLWSFNFSRYRSHVLHDGEQPAKGIGGALWDVFNISDIWEGVAYAFWHRIPSSWIKADVAALEQSHSSSGSKLDKPSEPVSVDPASA